MSKEVNVLEYAGGSKPHKVDREKGIIQRVKILGHTSTNGQRYTSSAVAGAKALYENVRVNINHPDPRTPGIDRDFADWFGKLQNVTESQGELFGDLHYLKSHKMAEVVAEAAERFPQQFGLSHNAVVFESEQDGRTVYHTINRVRSVDLVCKPGTTRGIFESERDQYMDPNAPVAAEVAPAGGSDMTLQMFIDKATEIYKGDGDGASKATQIGKVAKALFKVQDQLDAALSGGTEKKAEAPPAEKTATESAKDTTAVELDKLRRRNAARDVLESEGIPYGDNREIQIAALSGLSSDDERRALAKTWKGAAAPASAKPKSTSAAGTSVLESQADKDAADKAKPYSDPKRAAAALMGRG